MGVEKVSAHHRFALGQRVRLHNSLATLSFPNAEYEVTRLLPGGLIAHETGSLQYVLRDIVSGLNRVAREDTMVLLDAAPALYGPQAIAT